MKDSNIQPTVCKTVALPIELISSIRVSGTIPLEISAVYYDISIFGFSYYTI